jgi:hypothetical protein
MTYQVIGRPVPRTDSTKKVTGAARYTSDVLLPRCTASSACKPSEEEKSKRKRFIFHRPAPLSASAEA